MNKDSLIAAMAEKAPDLTKKQCEMALNAFVEGVSEALAKEDKVTLIGFGTFSVVERAARTGRNPSTGEPMEIPAKKVPKFSPGTSLKDKVAGK
jgi:DNA-binding protein HU-beta